MWGTNTRGVSNSAVSWVLSLSCTSWEETRGAFRLPMEMLEASVLSVHGHTQDILTHFPTMERNPRRLQNLFGWLEHAGTILSLCIFSFKIHTVTPCLCGQDGGAAPEWTRGCVGCPAVRRPGIFVFYFMFLSLMLYDILSFYIIWHYIWFYSMIV